MSDQSKKTAFMAALASMGPDAFAEELAQRLNVRLDVPFISEVDEEAWLIWGLKKVAPYMTGDIRQLLVDASDGLSDEEIARHKAIILSGIKENIDLPWGASVIVNAVLGPILDELFQYLQEGLAVQ